jgi:hypothetical protein
LRLKIIVEKRDGDDLLEQDNLPLLERGSPPPPKTVFKARQKLKVQEQARLMTEIRTVRL